MEDSSSNPYIPGSSKDLANKVERPQTAFARMSKITLIVSGILLVIIGIALYFMFQYTTSTDEDARAEFAEVLQPSSQLSKIITIKSSMGFTINYQSLFFSSHGEIGLSRIAARELGDAVVSETYQDNDLKREREYGLIRLTPIESSERARTATALPPELEIKAFDKPLLLKTDEHKAAQAEAAKGDDDKTLIADELAVSTFISIDRKERLGNRTSDDGTVVSIESSKPVRKEIAGVEYQKVRYTTSNENYQVKSVKYDDCYYAIQHGQPYSVCIINIRPNQLSQAALLEETMRLVSYEEPTADVILEQRAAQAAKEAAAKAKAEGKELPKEDTAKKEDDKDKEGVDETELGETVQEDVDQLVINAPYVQEVNILKSMAKNQPNIMRIGTLYCANIDLKEINGSTVTKLTSACATKVSTGVFISNSGHIATAGHAVKFAPKEAINGYINLAETQEDMQDRLQQVIDYLLESKLILETTAEYLETGAKTGNQEALAKIENIGSIIPDDYVQVSNEEYSYALQLTEKPIVVNRATGNKPSFAYSDAVVKADFVKSDYDAKEYEWWRFDTPQSANDVAILKTDGTFPVSTIGAGNGLRSKEKVITIGFPAFVDSSLTADKILNIPQASMSEVNQTFEIDGRKIIDVSVPTLPGSDGAPVFDANANLVGFEIYGRPYCPDQQCFASGTVRSSNPLSALIDKNNIELENKSDITKTWSEGIDAYFVGNYKVAAGKFEQTAKMYGFHQSATKLAELAKSKFGTPTDTSFMNLMATIGIIAEIILGVIITVVGILLFIHLKRLDMLQVGHYGAPMSVNTETMMPAPPPMFDQAAPYNQAPMQPQQQYPPQAGYGYPQQPQQQPDQWPSAQTGAMTENQALQNQSGDSIIDQTMGQSYGSDPTASNETVVDIQSSESEKKEDDESKDDEPPKSGSDEMLVIDHK